MASVDIVCTDCEAVWETGHQCADATCANGHRCASEEGVCMLCGEPPKFEYETEAGAFVPSSERLRLVKDWQDDGWLADD